MKRSKASEKRTAHRKRRHWKVQLDRKKITWLFGHIIRNVLKRLQMDRGMEPLKYFVTFSSKLNTKVFLYSCRLVPMQWRAQKNGKDVKLEKKRQAYGKLGMASHNKLCKDL